MVTIPSVVALSSAPEEAGEGTGPTENDVTVICSP
jgi:hypothetical protein